MKTSLAATPRTTGSETTAFPRRLGAHRKGATFEFLVWAPFRDRVEVSFVDSGQRLALERIAGGYFAGQVEADQINARYFYRLDDKVERPDPASRWQPEGVHGPSAVLPTSVNSDDNAWRGITLADYIFYELHIGTYTPAGTFAAAIERLPELRELGVTAVEILPVAEFPGARNWGYDGVSPFAVHHAYGGPLGLKEFVGACHGLGLAVVLDVVYNHLGPEGNYLADFGPYFTDRYHTPWGSAINFDGAYSDDVVRYFSENALQWLDEFQIDALRLDAIHGIIDRNANPFLSCLSKTVDELALEQNRHIHLIAESDSNDFRVTQSADLGGYGMQAQWSDDFHHALHCLQTGERDGYYEDFGRIGDLAKAFQSGFVYEGQYSSYRKRRQGSSAHSVQAVNLVVCSQNHDQIGNRMLGERSSVLLDFEVLKLSAAVVLLSPFLPLLFMGEEFAETHPFLYFTSHGDPALAEAVRNGRRREFSAFTWQGEPLDPQSNAAFESSKLSGLRELDARQLAIRDFYRELIRLRKTVPALRDLSKHHVETMSSEELQLLILKRGVQQEQVLALFNFNKESVPFPAVASPGRWKCLVQSASTRWHGPGSSIPDFVEATKTAQLELAGHSASLFCREIL